VLRCTDFTENATVSTCRAWVASEGITKPTEDTVPSVLVRRSGSPGLESTFACVLDVHRGKPGIRDLRRIDTGNPSDFLTGWVQDNGDRVWVWIRDGDRSPGTVSVPGGGTLQASGPIAAVAISRNGAPKLLANGGGIVVWNTRNLGKGGPDR